jgi:predicted Zn-dependent protease
MERHLVTQILRLALAALLCVPAGLAQAPAPPKSSRSLEKEIALGRTLAADIEGQAEILADPAVAGYIDRLGQNLARHSGVSFSFSIKVIDSGAARAIALPGGFLFVTSGLIVRSGTEAELAALMAHQIAHIAARHGMRLASRSQGTSASTVPLIFAGGWTGVCTRFPPGPLVPNSLQRFLRGFEQEADLLASEYLHKAGYDPTTLGPQPPADDQPKVVTTSTFDDIKARLTAAPPAKPRPASPSLKH